MKNLLLTSLAAGALAATTLGLTAGANAAPAGPSSVDTTINQLREQGFEGNRESHRHRCAGAVQRSARFAPARRSRAAIPGPAYPDPPSTIVTTVTGKTVYVDIVC